MWELKASIPPKKSAVICEKPEASSGHVGITGVGTLIGERKGSGLMLNTMTASGASFCITQTGGGRTPGRGGPVYAADEAAGGHATMMERAGSGDNKTGNHQVVQNSAGVRRPREKGENSGNRDLGGKEIK